MRRAAVGRINGVKAIFDQTAVDSALRNLVGGVPRRFIGHASDIETVGLVTPAVAQHAI